MYVECLQWAKFCTRDTVMTKEANVPILKKFTAEDQGKTKK